MKLLKILSIAVLFTISTFTNASLLTEDDYITVDHNGTDLDWTWASNYSVEFLYEFGVLTNQLFAPETVVGGWREATADEFSFFKANISAVDFLDRNTGGWKNSIEFFNSDVTLALSDSDLNRGDVNSKFIEDSAFDRHLGAYNPSAVFDTFYVRDTPTSGPAKPIPEPLSILIFATALFILQTKLRKKSI